MQYDQDEREREERARKEIEKTELKEKEGINEATGNDLTSDGDDILNRD